MGKKLPEIDTDVTSDIESIKEEIEEAEAWVANSNLDTSEGREDVAGKLEDVAKWATATADAIYKTTQ